MAEFVQDGTTDFSLGQDAWHKPSKLRENQYASGVNLSTRGAVLSPRNGFHSIELDFEEGGIETRYGYVRSYRQIWEAGKFQAAIPQFSGSETYLITVVSGLIFRTNIRTRKTMLMSEDIRVDQYQARINWSHAGRFLVIFDFPDYPIIIEEDTIRRADPEKNEVPISNNGTYNQNRLFIADAGTQFTAGDPVGSLATPEAPITFNEILVPSSPFFDQSFALDTDEAQSSITAMGFIQQLDTSTGIGPLFIATERNFFYYQSGQPRDQWDQGQFGGIFIANAGVAGPRAFTNVNSDILFLSAEGKVHAFSTSRNDFRKWGNTSISREVENYLVYSDQSLAQFAVLGTFDNRIFISANPYRVQALTIAEEPILDYAHGGFVVIEIDNLASFLSEGTPTWAGLWTGVNPMEIVNFPNRCFVISKDAPSVNVLYELKKDSTFDVVRGHKRRVKSLCYTREYEFQDAFGLKREHLILLHLQKLAGKIDLTIFRKPSQSPAFDLWAEWHYDAPAEVCQFPPDILINGLAYHEFKHLIFGDPDVERFNPVTKEPYSIFRAVQVLIEIRGDYWELEDLKITARKFEYQELGGAPEVCDPLPLVAIPKQCSPDWLIPEVDLCLLSAM